MKTRAGVEKYYKVPGAGHKHADWVSSNKIKHFKVLFNIIRGKVGTYDGARNYIGLNAGALDLLEKGRLTARNGHKILDAYNKIKAQ